MEERARQGEAGRAARRLLPVLGVLLAFAVAALTFPLPHTTFFQDDWHFLADLLRRPFGGFVFRIHALGHFQPAYLLLYGAVLRLSGFDPLPLQAALLAVRLATVGTWIALLRRTGCLTVPSTLLLVPLAACYVGTAEVFYWTATGGQELAMLGFALGLSGALRFREAPRPRHAVAAGAGLLIAIFSFSNGLAAPPAVAAALAVLRRRDRPPGGERGIRLDPLAGTAGLALLLEAVMLFALKHPGEGRTPPPGGPVRAWFGSLLYGMVVNGPWSALAGPLLPGALQAAAWVATIGAAAAMLRSSQPAPRQALVAALLCGELLVGCLVATARSAGGVGLASSYRYLHYHLAFYFPLLAVLVGAWLRPPDPVELRTRRLREWAAAAFAVAVLALALSGAYRGRGEWLATDRQRARCLEEIVRGEEPPCLPDLLYTRDAALIRFVWKEIRPSGGAP